MRRRGFTIIELLAVIAILAILMTIVVTAAAGVFRASRAKRTESMRVALQAAIASYHAADSSGQWPSEIESLASTGESGWLSDSAAQRVFCKIVQRSMGVGGSALPLVDPSALFVAPSGATDRKTYGLSFNEARQGNKKGRNKKNVTDLIFGYPDASTGRFRRFYIHYSAASDSVTVSTSK